MVLRRVSTISLVLEYPEYSVWDCELALDETKRSRVFLWSLVLNIGRRKKYCAGKNLTKKSFKNKNK